MDTKRKSELSSTEIAMDNASLDSRQAGGDRKSKGLADNGRNKPDYWDALELAIEKPWQQVAFQES